MEPLGGVSPMAMFGVVGAVIVVAALLSGLVERSHLPQILVFLLLGALLGPWGFGIVALGIESPTLQIISTLGLLLVLFTDAVSVAFTELRRNARLAAIVLGPGTLVTAAVTAAAAFLLLGLRPAESAILGAALASTDPVILRGLLRNPDTPAPARNALRIESGMNDAVLLPVVLAAIAILAGADPASEGSVVGAIVFDVFVLGGGAGVAVGLLSVGALAWVRRRVGMRRDYESLYALGVALSAFAVAESIGGSGFLAAFTAGLTIAAVDVELCDCFFDYGDATAEMAILLTFVVLGGWAIWTGITVVNANTLLFAAVALFARTVILLPALAWSGLDRQSRRITLWFGPRGLSSLLLVLLPVFAGIPGTERLFAVCSLVVLLSVVIHGGSQMFAWPAMAPAIGAAPEPAAGAAAVARAAGAPGPRPAPAAVPTDDRISLAALHEIERRGEPVVILDARTEASYRGSPTRATGAVRIPPDRAVATVSALGLPHDAWLVAYCT